MNYQHMLERYGYKLVDRPMFEAATDLPTGLLERAASTPGAYVVYDPDDNDEGFMLIRDNKDQLAKEAWEHLDVVDAVQDPE